MPRFSFRVFVWIFGIANAVVWFGIAFAAAHLVQSGLGDAAGLSRSQALWTVCIAPLALGVLAVQGAVVNLRAQYLDGRFHLPAPDAAGSQRPLTSPWIPAWRLGVTCWLIGFPILLASGWRLFPATVPARMLGVWLGSFAGLVVVVATLSVGVAHFHAFAARLGQRWTIPSRAWSYLGWRLALPWGLINLILNAVIGWITYHRFFVQQPPQVPFSDFRVDLVIMTVLLSILIPMAAMPEAMCDAAVGTVEMSEWLPAMPPLARRLLAVIGIGFAVWLVLTLVPLLVHRDHLSAWMAVSVKAVWAGVLAAGCAALWGGWALPQRGALRLEECRS